jgi:hypothetical protein
MAMETAAAILTKLAFEQNTDLKSRLNVVQGNAKDLIALMMPLFRQILSELEKDRQTHDKFPSAVARRSPGRSDKAPPSALGNTKDAHAGERSDEGEDIGGEG